MGPGLQNSRPKASAEPTTTLQQSTSNTSQRAAGLVAIVLGESLVSLLYVASSGTYGASR